MRKGEPMDNRNDPAAPSANSRDGCEHPKRASVKKKAVTLGLFACLVALTAGLAACAPSEPSGEPSGGSQAGKDASSEPIQVDWSIDMDCSTCHATEQDSFTDSACEASLHADMACKDCHNDATKLATVHEGKTASDKMPTRLKKTEVSDELCFSCHYENRDALIEATEGKAVLTDSEGTSRNPHDPEGIEEHESLACGDCHNMHSTETVQERAMKQCESCHHAGVFQCYTCHE